MDYKALFILLLMMGLLGVALGTQLGFNRGMWTERCQHIQCKNGQASWDRKESCVCITKAEP